MTLVRYNNWLPKFFDDNFTKELEHRFDHNSYGSKSSIPAVNVKETKNAFELEVAVPGMKKDDFKVEINNDVLTIAAKQEDKKEEKDDNGKYTRREFHYHSFQRSFRLPKNQVDGDNIAAKYEHGVLYLNVPKREEAKEKPARLIEIA
ncbi:Hsp20/alpha crystallin family protein [Catalinimonas niigatensis]|uniref:Hsp20/alpha crystallin family protein n=1 Tax=Catalinimonas niigatensis TaxID=1397264 RepID=UPI00266684F7|nr:Hsp20/alpha crystallin family protein [Catalinimonas niigatensis]WPP50214.1 Hsp20/alpha crystallin family protein [Catalinimonas niigatensis]